MREFIIEAIGLVNTATQLLVGIAVLAFFWGIVKFIGHAGDENKQKEGKNIMVWGIVGLFVMLSTWGIIKVLQSELGITGVTTYGKNAEFGETDKGQFKNIERVLDPTNRGFGKNGELTGKIELEGKTEFGENTKFEGSTRWGFLNIFRR